MPQETGPFLLTCLSLKYSYLKFAMSRPDLFPKSTGLEDNFKEDSLIRIENNISIYVPLFPELIFKN